MKLVKAGKLLKEPCICCGVKFKKGDMYWRERQVIDDYDCGLTAFNTHWRPRCKYKHEDSERRRVGFPDRCPHPEEWVFYNPDPDNWGDWCHICGRNIST